MTVFNQRPVSRGSGRAEDTDRSWFLTRGSAGEPPPGKAPVRYHCSSGVSSPQCAVSDLEDTLAFVESIKSTVRQRMVGRGKAKLRRIYAKRISLLVERSVSLRKCLAQPQKRLSHSVENRSKPRKTILVLHIIEIESRKSNILSEKMATRPGLKTIWPFGTSQGWRPGDGWEWLRGMA